MFVDYRLLNCCIGSLHALSALKSRNRSVVGNKLLCSSQVAAASDVEAVILTVYKLSRIPG